MSQYRKRRKIYRLIYEGNNKTERTFFQHYFGNCSSYNPIDKILPNEKTDPQSLFDLAESEIRRLHLSQSLGDKVFIVLDLDHRPDHFAFVKKHALDNRLVIFVPSQPCIEVFFLLHFVELESLNLKGDEVIAILKRHIQNYDKSVDVFNCLESHDKEATVRLRTLSKNGRIKGTMTVADLIDLLKK
jgi:hypothetical protein